MDWKEFLEKVIGHVAWPIAAFFIVAQFKNELRDFVKRIRTAKYKDVEVNLGEEIQAVKQEAENFGITIFYPEAAFPPDDVRDVEAEPEWAFIRSWQDIESLLKALHQSRTGLTKKREPIPKIIKFLVEQGVIQKDLADLLFKIQDVRNKIVHVEDSRLTRGEALEWLGISKSVKDRLSQRLR